MNYKLIAEKQRELITELKSIIDYYKSIAFPNAEVMLNYAKEGQSIQLESEIKQLESEPDIDQECIIANHNFESHGKYLFCTKCKVRLRQDNEFEPDTDDVAKTETDTGHLIDMPEIEKQSEPTERKTAEEMTHDEEKILCLFTRYSNCEGKSPIKLPCMTRSAFVEAVKEYSRLFASQSLPEISNADIEKMALNKSGLENPKTSCSKYDTLNLIWGAKWYRNEIKSRL